MDRAQQGGLGADSGRKCGVRICCPLLGIAGKLSYCSDIQQRLLHILEQLKK